MSLAVAEISTGAGRARPGFPLWQLSLLWLVALLVAQATLFLLFQPYDRNADPDLIAAYDGLLMSSGAPQEYFDHPGYIYFLLLGGWFRLLHGLGLLPAATLATLPGTADIGAFEAAWQQIVVAGRGWSLVTLAIFAVVVAVLTARLFRDRRIGFLAGLALATGAGQMAQLGVMRPEPLSSLFVIAALLLTLLAANGDGRRRLLMLGLAGFLAVAAVETKVFAILPLAAIPVLALVFGTRHAPDKTGVEQRRRAVVLAVAALIIGIPGGYLIWSGVANIASAKYAYHAIGGGVLGFYQGWLALYVAGCIALYARIWRVPVADTVSAAAAIVIGISLGMMLLLIRYDLQNVIAVTHPVEHLFVFSTWSDPSLAKETSVVSGALLAKLVGLAAGAVAKRVTQPGADNLLALDVLVLGALVVGIFCRDRRWMIGAGLLFLVSWGMQVVFLLRYDQLTYHTYSDPFTVLAAAVVLARFRRQVLDGVASVAVVAVVVGYACWGLYLGSAWSSRHPAGFCEAHDSYWRQLERFPFCSG